MERHCGLRVAWVTHLVISYIVVHECRCRIFDHRVRYHFQLVRLGIDLISRFLNLALAHSDPAPIARMVVYRRGLAGIPNQHEQRERLVVGGNQITRIILRRVGVGISVPPAATQIESTEEIRDGVK